MLSRFRYIGVLALILSVTAHIPSAICSGERDIAAKTSCCVPNNAGDSCCCGTTVACEFTPNTNDLDLASPVASEYPVDVKSSAYLWIECAFPSNVTTCGTDVNDRIPRSLTFLRTTILLL